MAVKHVGQTQPKKTLGFLIKLIAGYHEHPRLSSLIGQVSSFYKIVCHSLSHREIGSTDTTKCLLIQSKQEPKQSGELVIQYVIRR